ncbi:winged helix-turn-helix domain-containing protein [Kosakonia oryzae]|uniref:Helix-turn-helix domain-containing protein n=1 Tax=Kosakonia oryzae TaxID=497725 RepID=A0AA94H093_9ENTR|nr:helix-turn-helix domain-containing protein [Kosakonia oryzae]ANI84039.1 helix-turn-helix domain-containing protein [Kosakonia oryzae]UDJ81147.1 helix-turn-helix domain-containing protein [Kosakonia oryzae]SFB72739.1 Transcriptional regulatory protein, C terminal [Kosakonia oryzae]
MEKLTVYGYRLGKNSEIEFLPFKKSLIRYGSAGGNVNLRLTMANLLTYLLSHAVGTVVADKALQIHVWENHGLRCSSQRLWQVMNNLKRKLEQFDLPEDFILRVAGKGYMIPDEMVLKLYCREGFFKADGDAPLQ